MKILGNDGLGKKLKVFLVIAFIIAIPIIIFLPFIMNHMARVNSMIIIYPNGILMLGLVYQFILLFKSLEKNNPFTYNNVNILKRTGIISLIISIVWCLDLFYLVFMIGNTYFNYILVLVFLAVLFFGVFIALYILSELIKQATIYKEENDLTI